MSTKKSLLKQILARLALLILPLLGIYLLMEFFYDPHARCTGNEHHHTMGPVGYVILAAAVVIFWVLAIIFEQILRYFKKDRKISFLIIFLFLIVIISIVFFI
ncbi:hypothetical protein [Pedobacter miscanthi]|uniref:hypothetical protein n=1 Tax=Pedobacter miscanthi TaxID=2259170 RepID=UPI0029311C3F|nr:hypothetical protein [Pedobacter miscanthi]